MKSLLFLLLFLLSLRSLSQKDNYYTLDVRSFEASEKISLPFSAIKVLDARFDKTNIGCITKVHIGKDLTYISSNKPSNMATRFPDSLHNYLPKLLSKIITFDKNNTDTLLLLVKQFRIVDHLFNIVNLELEPQVLLKFSVSFFRLANEQLSKISEINNLYPADLPTDKIYDDTVHAKLRIDALMSLLQNIFYDKQWSAAASGITSATMAAAIKKRFQLPLFSDNFLKVGVYRTFKEFKNNQPSVTNILIKKNSDLLVSVKDSLGDLIDVKKFWGLCDGKKQYISFRGEFCELLPRDKSFCFLGNYHLSDFPRYHDYNGQVLQNLPPAIQIPLYIAKNPFKKKYETDKTSKYFYLNMDEEQTYLEEIFGMPRLKN